MQRINSGNFNPGDWIVISDKYDLNPGCYGVKPGIYEVLEINKDAAHQGMLSTDLDVIAVRYNNCIWFISGTFRRATMNELTQLNLSSTNDTTKPKENMKNLNVLPDCWHVIVTENNRKALALWREVCKHDIKIGELVGTCKARGVFEKGHNPGHLVKSSTYDFGKEISFNDFKRLVLNEYIFPENWAIKRTPETDEVITEYVNAQKKYGHHYPLSQNPSFPWILSKPIEDWENTVSARRCNTDYDEITFEEFEKHVLKKSEKILVGYKLIKEYPLSEVEGYIERNLKSSIIQGYPEFWEPVYEDEFKVGDWVTMLNKDGWMLETKGSTFEIIAMQTMYWHGMAWPVKSPCGQTGGIYGDYRKATEQEIKDAQIPIIEINGYTGIFYEDYIKFGCAEIDKNYFIHFKGLGGFEKGNKKIEAVTIGKGTFTMNDIVTIADYYLKK